MQFVKLFEDVNLAAGKHCGCDHKDCLGGPHGPPKRFHFPRAGAGAGTLAGTWFATGFMVIRYAQMALRSSSVILLYISCGIGGRIPTPFGFLPVLNMATKVFSLYPRAGNPVLGSGVRFEAKVVPHGPVQAVRSSAV